MTKMGTRFLIINPKKKQYIDPCCFGESNELSGYMRGYHAVAVALLVCDQGPYIEIPSGRAGAWCGDRVHVVYNTDEFNPLEIVAATAEDPGRTLYAMVQQEFDDLSREAVAIVCNWVDGAAQAVARRARKEAGPPDQNHLLWNLGRIVFNNWSPRLKQALAEHYGPDWAQDYERTKATFDHSKKWYEF